nr:protein trigalactosyldiacylglycerol 2, chloroplastic [Quercus suber]
MSQIKALAEDVQPLLAEVCDSGLLQDVDKLTRILRVHSSIMTLENTVLIQDSIQTLLFTLKNIEYNESPVSSNSNPPMQQNVNLKIYNVKLPLPDDEPSTPSLTILQA